MKDESTQRCRWAVCWSLEEAEHKLKQIPEYHALTIYLRSQR